MGTLPECYGQIVAPFQALKGLYIRRMAAWETEVEQDIHFSNSQDYIINNSLFSLKLAQNTTISSVTETESHGDHATEVQKFDWPFALTLSFP